MFKGQARLRICPKFVKQELTFLEDALSKRLGLLFPQCSVLHTFQLFSCTSEKQNFKQLLLLFGIYFLVWHMVAGLNQNSSLEAGEIKIILMRFCLGYNQKVPIVLRWKWKKIKNWKKRDGEVVDTIPVKLLSYNLQTWDSFYRMDQLIWNLCSACGSANTVWHADSGD